MAIIAMLNDSSLIFYKVRRLFLSMTIDTINSQIRSVTGLELCNISCEKAYRRLFSGLSVSLSAGQCLRILGSNGSGKTSLLKIIAGLSRDFEGVIHWQVDERSQAFINKSELLYLGHLTGVKASLTPVENLSWWVSLCLPTYHLQHKDICNALSQLGLGCELNTPCHLLSAGQQRRVALARLILSQQKVWILDEPFTAIDPLGISQVEHYIKQHQSDGGMAIITSHQIIHHVELLHLDLADYQQGAK